MLHQLALGDDVCATLRSHILSDASLQKGQRRTTVPNSLRLAAFDFNHRRDERRLAALGSISDDGSANSRSERHSRRLLLWTGVDARQPRSVQMDCSGGVGRLGFS